MQLKQVTSIILAFTITIAAQAQMAGGSIGTKGAHSFSILSNGQSRLTVTPEGNVGIGTTSPAAPYKLSVNGDVKARKLKITVLASEWPDYVFAPSYRLPSLGEVERFIKTNKHLPEVPSAQQVEKEGLDVGDTQAMLLKKIEELTLYLIDLKKQSDQQKKEIEQLKIALSIRSN